MAYTTYSPFDYERFRFQALLGCGSFGSVYRAIDTTLGHKQVAIKVQHKAQAGSRVAQRQHEETYMHTALCDHPKIKAISFVGGDRAGKHIYERGRQTGKRVQVRPFIFIMLWRQSSLHL